MGTPGGHSEARPSVLLPGPGREKKANLLSLFSQGGERPEGEGGNAAGGGGRASGQEENETEGETEQMQKLVHQFSKQTA